MTNPPETLGNSTLQVGRIGLGCMGMSEFYSGTLDGAGHIKTLHAAIDLGQPLRYSEEKRGKIITYRNKKIFNEIIE